MKMRAVISMAILAGTFLLPVDLVRAAEDPVYQERLEKEQARIDAAVVQAGGTIAQEWSLKFNLKPELIQIMRDEGPGWGEISVVLSMSRQLAQEDPKDYPTYTDALKRIRTLRSGNATYETIAKQSEFRLQPVIDEVQRIRRGLQGEKRSVE